MNDNDLISVIVPVYNVEQYLPKCIESIINQTYANLEIILVDDGSTDASPQICDEYAKKDSRIVVIHKINGGLGSARNIGMSKCNGKYICFVDSDDYINLKTYELMLSAMIDDAVDIVTCGRVNVFEDGSRKEQFCGSKVILEKEEAIKNFLMYSNMDAAVWDKLFKRDTIINMNFPNRIYCEDIPITFETLCKVNRISHINNPLYYYLQRSDSISHSNYNPNCLGIKIFPREILDKTKSKFPNLINEAESYYFKNINAYLKRLSMSDERALYKNESEELKREFLFKIIKSKLISQYIKRDLVLHCLKLYVPLKKLINA